MNDLGSVHERAAAIFTLHLAQASITVSVCHQDQLNINISLHQ
jgi:hypothetical protein